MANGQPQDARGEWYALAIDFGTSNTCAAVLRPGADPVPLRLGYSGNSMPSAVLVKGDRMAIGEDALRLAALHPQGLERTPKRRLGEPTILLDGREWQPTDLVAAVLRRVVKTAAQQSRGVGPSTIVLTHPAAWGNHMLGKLREAAVRAGTDPRRTELVAEPLAAAWRHVEGAGVAAGDEIAVADFGGGTFDVARLSTETGPEGLVLHVGTVDGMDPLGGDDFDEQIERWVRDQLVSEGRRDLLDQLDSATGLAARSTLREEITRAKHALSHHASAPLAVVVGAERMVLTISAPEFERMIRPAVARAVDVTRSLLGERDVRHLFLTGGSSLIPLVQREFQELTDGRVGTLGDPKEVTSVGALIASERHRPAPTEGPPPVAVPPAEPPRRGGRGWVHWAAAAAILLGLLVGGGGVWAWAVGDDSSQTAREQVQDGSGAATDESGPTEVAGKPPGRGTEPEAEDPPPAEPLSTVSQPPPESDPECARLSAPQCELVGARSELVVAGSCSPLEVRAPVRDGVQCTPSTSSASITGTAVVYLYATDAVADSESVIADFFTTHDIDISAQARSDVLVPPAWNTWQNAQGEALGRIYSHSDGGAARLVWTYEQDLVHVELASTGGDVTDLYSWWTATVRP